MKKKKNRGFTILELMITLVILGIFAALSVSIARTAVERASFTTAINQFVSDFYFSRQLAARENKYVAIVFNNNGRSYTMRILNSMIANPELEANYIELKEVEPMPEKQFFAGVTSFAFSSTGVIRAYPVDLDAAPASFSLTFLRETSLPGEKGFEKTIQVYPSGGIKIDRSSRE
ncbi:MAG: prepilin-type N-terminal cleavage/methylation domain-containing protein [Candidatus Aminicenantes bacterium]|nr:prepilin-type N-terminal cleavage/methylation domain-containing protein [Candidatus Aminicenantes bacterium]